MALAEVQAVINANNQRQQGQRQQQELDQQQKQHDAQLKLEQQKLELEHGHQQATLAALQAFQRSQQFNTLAQNPAMVRAMGQQTGSSGEIMEGNSMTSPPTQESYSVPSQVQGEQPFNINLNSRDEEARQQGQEAALKNVPSYQQQTDLETQKANAQQNSAMMRAYIDHEHDLEKQKLINESEERRNQATVNASKYGADVSARSRITAAGMGIQRQFDPTRVEQMVNDLHNGDTSIDDFRKSTLSPVEKEAVSSGLATGNSHGLSKDQQDYITKLSNIKEIVPLMKQFIAGQPESSSSLGGLVKGGFQSLPGVNAEQKRLQDEMASKFGELSKALSSGVALGRISNFEAQKLMGYLPTYTSPQSVNLKRLNDFTAAIGGHMNNALSNIPMAQRTALVDKKIGMDNFKQYIDLDHLKQGMGSSNETEQRIKVRHKATGQTGTLPPSEFNDAEYEKVQ